MDELLGQFLIEAPELSAQASADLLALERDPSQAALVDSAFRAVHTLKGSVALFDFASMAGCLHAAEDLLGALRSRRLAVTSMVIDALLDTLGQCDAWLAAIAKDQALPGGADADAARLLHALRAAERGGAAAAPPAPADMGGVQVTYRPASDAFFRGDDPLAVIKAAPGLRSLAITGPSGQAEPYDPFTCDLVFEAAFDADLAEIEAAFRLVADQVTIAPSQPHAALLAPPPAPQEPPLVRQLRVDAGHVDALASEVEQLVVARNALTALVLDSATLSAQELRSRLQVRHDELTRLTAALHRGVARIRLTPLEPVFRRLQRTVRDLAGHLGKPVRLEVEGQGVELDKAIVDGLYEPVLHILRNALDHGVETAEIRRAAGKPLQAGLSLAARRRGEQVLIEVGDDGAGIDPARLRRAAVARGQVTSREAEALSDADALDLIFAPGFSTAEAITAVSGRGVGMDAVRAAATQMGGRISLASTMGIGTKVTLSLPLTLVMTPLMIVGWGEDRYGVPLDDIAETVQIAAHEVQQVRLGRVFVRRDRPIPLIELGDLLGLPGRDRNESALRVVVVTAAGEPFGIVVDRVGPRIDAVLRPLGGLLASLPGVTGTTLLGDGQVLMVLDLPGLVA